jgi:hypothetical protein
MADVFLKTGSFKDDYPILESNLNQNYFVCDLNHVFSRFNSTAMTSKENVGFYAYRKKQILIIDYLPPSSMINWQYFSENA